MKLHILVFLAMHGIIVITACFVAYYTTSVIPIAIAIIAELAILAFYIRRFFHNVYNTINIHKAEAEFVHCIISAERTHHQKMAEMYETMSVLRHDFKYHLKVIDELLQTGNTGKIELYLTEIRKRMPEDELYYYCPDSVINALLASYAKNCEKFNIKYNVKIALPKAFSVLRYDICVILGNLLENALEACKKLESGGEIDLTMKANEQYLTITVKNSFDGVVIEKNGELTSTKKDGGFGLRSIRAVAERYGGHISIERAENVFTIYVMVNV
ncbi:MAG: ATP-binding protein [Fibromonadaceae bacterium]|jgi:sensor histidine kinase regulating citrate/malate metabolism|nr:ATP-binding protein [Fibromonadaceae bacterium]